MKLERQGKSWQKIELTWLYAQAKRGVHWNEISEGLQRSVTACYARYGMMRFSEFWVKGTPENETMLTFHRDNPVHKEGYDPR